MTRDRARDEAERLVAAAIAAVSLAARGMGAGRSGSAFATGSAECCICPVCRLIASMRDPNADLAERLASGAGDLATGVASMLRALSRSGHGAGSDDRGRTDDRAREGDRGREGDEFWESLRQRATEQARAWSGSPGFGRTRSTDVDDEESDVERDPWRMATTAASGTPPPKPMAKKAVARKVVAKKTVAPKVTLPGASEPAAPPGPIPPAPATRGAPVKKAAAKKAAAKKAAPSQTARSQTARSQTGAAKAAPSQAAPTKAAAKRAAPKKAVPRAEEFE